MTLFSWLFQQETPTKVQRKPSVVFAKFHDFRTPRGSVREDWIPRRQRMSSSSAAVAGEKQRRKMMMVIDKGGDFMGFDLISSMDDEVFVRSSGFWVGIKVICQWELQRDKTR